MLFCSDGIGFPRSMYGAGNGSIFLDDVNCLGNESTIIDCEKNPWGINDCSHSEDASVQCFSHKGMMHILVSFKKSFFFDSYLS